VATQLDFTNKTETIQNIFHTFISNSNFQAVYTETNGFDINPDTWDFDLFGFENRGALDDDSWFGDFTHDSEVKC
tara:strand:- start:137 stop:361 length:225 start_codon:yes stop_codon:yes gene_type:complete